MIEDGIERETVTTSVITSSKPLECPLADCQIRKYFSHEEKSVHILNLDTFPKKS